VSWLTFGDWKTHEHAHSELAKTIRSLRYLATDAFGADSVAQVLPYLVRPDAPSVLGIITVEFEGVDNAIGTSHPTVSNTRPSMQSDPLGPGR
jgi:hypothetical protein